MEQDDKSFTEEQPVKSKAPVWLSVAVVVLGIGLLALVFMYFTQKTNMIEMETLLTEEKDSLTNELVMLMHGYDTLKTNNDSLNAQLEEEQNKIERLLSINANNVRTIRTYRKEISTMREIMKSYIVQIDSLNTRNKILVAENREIKAQINRVEATNVELSKTRDELNTKVEIASVIMAKDIIAVCLNKKRKETNRIDRMVNLRVCFTIRENPIAEEGKKVVYMRVTRPDGLVLTDSPDNLFEFDGGNMIFSASRAVDYLNQDVEMCVFYDNVGDFIEGNYTVDLYLEGSHIGVGAFMMR